MALHLNLFHEVEKRAALKRRDPLKLSMYGLGLVATGLAAYYGVQFIAASAASSDLARAELEYNKLKPQAEAAVKKQEQLADSIKTSETFVKRIEGRFYWAGVLEALTNSVPREVQVTKLAGEIASDSVRHGTITLEGLAAGTEPRKVAEDLRRSLNDKFAKQYKHVNATFTGLDDGKDTVMVKGIPQPTAVFTIKLALQVNEDEAPPAPKVAPKRGAATGGTL